MLNKAIKYFLHNRLITILILVCIIAWGLITAPFGWKINFLPSNPIPVDAIPDIGENQQIVFTQWMGGRHKILKIKLPIRLPHHYWVFRE